MRKPKADEGPLAVRVLREVGEVGSVPFIQAFGEMGSLASRNGSRGCLEQQGEVSFSFFTSPVLRERSPLRRVRDELSFTLYSLLGRRGRTEGAGEEGSGCLALLLSCPLASCS